MNKRLRIILGVILLVVVIVLLVIVKITSAGSGADARKPNASLVKVQPPKKQTLVERLEFQGDVLSIQQTNIFSKVNGTLEKIAVDMGSSVGKGQLLALIDTTELYQQYQQTSATYENAKLNYQRTKELSEQNLLAKQDLDNAETTMKVAQANFETARTRLSYAHITAPFAGYVTKRFLDPGAYISSSSTNLFTLMDLTEMKVIVNVLEKDLPTVKIGTKASLKVDPYPDKTFTGTVARMSQAIDLSTRTMAIEIDIPNQERLLRPGMFGTVRLVVREHPSAVTVPTQAVLHDNTGTFVFVVSNGSTAQRVNVVPGIEQEGWTEITSGLSGSETVITTGAQFVKDGGQVIIQS
jgi:RND family efflux transporter MFP subunit